MNSWQELLANVIAYALLLVVALAAVLVLLRYKPDIRGKLWPMHRLRPGNWSGLEVLLAFLVMFVAGALVRQTLSAAGFYEAILARPASPERQVLWATPLYFFLSLGLIFVLLFAMSRTRPSHMGLTWARWPNSAVQGLLAFVVVTPIVLAIYGLVLQILPRQRHGLEQVAEEGLWPAEWGLLLFQACVAAPILEELLFRGLLLGWLRRASLTGHVMLCVWTIFQAARPLMAALEGAEGSPPLMAAWQPLAFALCLVGWYVWVFSRVWQGLLREGPFYLVAPLEPEALERRNRRRRQELMDDQEADDDADEDEDLQPLLKVDPERFRIFQEGNIRLGILGSSMFFVVVHSDAWPSPMPLLLLALVLGAIAQRSQSLVGPIVLHAMFNAVAFGALLYVHTVGERNGNEETVAARPWDGGKTRAVAPASQTPRFKYASAITFPRRGEKTDDVTWPISASAWNTFDPRSSGSPSSAMVRPRSRRFTWPRSRAMTIGS